MKWHRYIFNLTILLLLFTATSCNSNQGTGLSENEEYLNHFSADEVIGIVLAGDYYLLPETVRSFIENGWQPNEITTLHFENLNDIILPAESFMDLWLTKDNMHLHLDVVNFKSEDAALLDATVTRLRTDGAKREQAIIIGGVTIGTSSEDIISILQSLSVEYHLSSSLGRAASVFIRNEAHYNGQVRVGFDDNVASSFTVELREIDPWENYTFHWPDASDAASEALFMSRSYYFEGVVMDIYYVVRPDAPVIRGETMHSGYTIVGMDDDGNIFAIRQHTRIDLESIHAGDRVKAYYGHTEHRGRASRHELIEYEDGSRIPYIRADVLVINDEIVFSLFDQQS